MITKEPLAISTYLGTIIGFMVAKYLPDIDPETRAAVVGFALAAVTGIAAFLRSKAFSENTIREAGMDPEEVQEKADNPEVLRKRKRASR